MKKIIFSADYGMGVGDFLIKLYAICHLNMHIKKTYSNFYTVFILEEYQSKILNQILNINFFQQHFDIFYIQDDSNKYISNLGANEISYNNEKFTRVYSAINDYTNNTKGYWEVYIDQNITELPDIDYSSFDYRDPTTRKSEPIPDFNLPILNSVFFNNAKQFIDERNIIPFECIYYKVLNTLDNSHLYKFINLLKSNISNNIKLFITSNSEIAKEILIKELPNSLSYKPLDITKPDGYGTAHSDQARMYDLLTEMILMSYATKIHYCGSYYYISLFNYYAHMVKRVPLIDYDVSKV